MKRLKAVVLAFLVLLIIAGIGGTTAYFLYQKNLQTREEQQIEAEAAQVADDLINVINESLAKTEPISWVYDADDTLLFAIRTASEATVTKSIPTNIAEKISAKYSRPLSTEVLYQYLIKNDMQEKATDSFLSLGSVYLSNKLDDTKLLQYLTTNATYGTVQGLESAAVEYFGKEFKDLNVSQQDFLVYAYNNKEALETEYMSQSGTPAEQLQFIDTNTTSKLLRYTVQTELNNIINSTGSISKEKLSEQSYTIKLSISMAQQQAMQSILDEQLRSYITLSSNGHYTIDASVAVLNNSTGLITSFVPSRTSRLQDSQVFSMNVGSWIDNFDKLTQRIAIPGQTVYSLQETKTSNGDTIYMGTDQQWDQQELVTAMDSYATSLQILDKVKTLVLDSPTSMIQQIKDLTDTVIYESEAPTLKQASDLNVLKLRQMFVEDPTKASKTLSSSIILSAGVLSFQVTQDYTVVVFLGSSVLGEGLSSDTKSELLTSVKSIVDKVKTFYPTPKANMFVVTEDVSSEMESSYASNDELVSKGIGEDLQHLSEIVIDSVDNRKLFESEYDLVAAELITLKSYLLPIKYSELEKELQSIRQERTEAILKYSV